MRGSFSGPMTMSATTPITRSSENPMSNMGNPETKKAPAGAFSSRAPALSLVLGPALDFAFDRLAGDLRRGAVVGRLVAAFAHPVLEAAHRAAKVGAHVAQLL